MSLPDKIAVTATLTTISTSPQRMSAVAGVREVTCFVKAEQKLIGLPSLQGERGPQGLVGNAEWGGITGDINDQSDLGSMAQVDDAPSDGAEYVRKNGNWSVSSGGGGGGGGASWGAITGTLSNQTDLQTALNAKANTADLGDLAYDDTVDYSDVTNTPTLGDLASKNTVDYTTEITNKPTLGNLAAKNTVNYATDVTNKPTLGALASKDTADYLTDLTNKPTLGTMSAIDDAPSNGSEYVRKNGTWAVSSGGGGGGGSATWGSITGTLSNQTDLNYALSAKADSIAVSQTLSMFAGDIAPAFSPDGNYSIGDYVIYGSQLYKYKANHSAGAWNASEVDAVAVTGELDNKADVTDITFDVFSESESYYYGQLVIYQSLLYRFIDNHTAGPWDSSDVSRITVSDLLNLKADVQSPALTGTPTAPTPTAGDSSTKIATTAYVQGEIAGKANTADLGDLASLNSVTVAKGGTGRSSLTSNAILAGNGTGNVKQISTASGALYATQSGGAASFGALPTAQGGTGGTDTGWESKTGDNFNGTIYYRKVGVFVAICAYQIKLKEDLSGSNITLLGSNSLPAPVIASSFPAGNNQGFGQIMIAANGSLNFYKETGTSWLSTRSINFTGIYITA